MRTQKVSGSDGGHFVELGGVTFLFMAMWINTKKIITMPGQNCAGLIQKPYGVLIDGQWQLRDNKNSRGYRDSYYGMALSRLGTLKDRLPDDIFMPMFYKAYEEALLVEANTMRGVYEINKD